MKKVTKTKIYLVVSAVLLIVLGILLICKPVEGLAELAWLFGALMLISGCFSLGFTIRNQVLIPNSASSALLALLQIILGIMFLANQTLTALTMTITFAIWIIVEGTQLAVVAFDYKRYGNNRWWIMLLLGICSMILGFIALMNPEATGLSISILTGIAVIINGLVRCVALFGISKIQHKVENVQSNIQKLLSEKID